MKVLFSLLISILLLNPAFTQKKVSIDLQFLPDTEYTQKSIQTNKQTIKYQAEQEVLDALKERGMSNPTINETKTSTKTLISTGPLEDNNKFNIKMDFTDTDGSKLPEGTKIYGWCESGEMPELDSIDMPGNDFNDDQKVMMLNLINKTFSQAKIPDNTMKIGSKFTYTTPFSIPIQTATLNMKIVTTYKLKKIENGIAYFDIVQKYQMETDIENMDMTAKGNGNGTATYHIQSKLMTNLLLNSEMIMHMKMKGLEMDLIQSSISETITEKLN